jgi:hypothetical protein
MRQGTFSVRLCFLYILQTRQTQSEQGSETADAIRKNMRSKKKKKKKSPTLIKHGLVELSMTAAKKRMD